MRILLDESVPRRLAGIITGHDVTTVVDVGWAGTQNGELLKLASAEFDVFVTVDKNLPQQQQLSQYAIVVVVLDAMTNRLEDLGPLVPSLLDVLTGPISSPIVLRLPPPRKG